MRKKIWQKSLVWIAKSGEHSHERHFMLIDAQIIVEGDTIFFDLYVEDTRSGEMVRSLSSGTRVDAASREHLLNEDALYIDTRQKALYQDRPGSGDSIG